MATVKPEEIVTVLADNYSTPAHVSFEEELKFEVNRRLGRLAVASVCRLDSKSTDGLQLVDLLTSAIAFEFKEAAGFANPKGAKGEVSRYVRAGYGTKSVRKGHRSEKLNVAIHLKRGQKRRLRSTVSGVLTSKKHEA
jgi:hypothetical protein